MIPELGMNEGASETLRLERVMDELRALVLWAVDNNELAEEVFQIIRRSSRELATDILNNNRILTLTLEVIQAEAKGLRERFGISNDEVRLAHEQQICVTEGFWWMRRYLGQFKEAVEEIENFRPDQLIGLGMSGCPIAAYIQLLMEREKIRIPLENLIFKRDNKIPIKGVLPENFVLTGRRVCIIEDIVNEPVTTGVALETLENWGRYAQYFLL